MRTRKLLFALVLALGALPALAGEKSDAKAAVADIKSTLGFVPDFLKQLPEATLPGAWEQMKGLELSTDSAIPPKYKELIGLAVAAQIPCKYCITAHTEFAKANGARPEELGAAISEAALTQHWSTVLNGTQQDMTTFRAEVNRMIEHSKAVDPNAPRPPPVEVTDARSALEDAKQQLGVVPGFLTAFPASALPGAWKLMRDVDLNPDGAIPPKYNNLISLAVSAQIPCDYCVAYDTEFARANGASDSEINEAVAIGALTRQMSTLLNGMQINEAKFKADVQRMSRPKKVSLR